MNVTVATGGEEALAAFAEAAASGKLFDLAILDHAMPEMDGVMLAKRLRDHPEFAATKLILASSIGRRNSPVAAEAIAVDAHLNKPTRRSVLLDCIANLCGLATHESAAKSAAPERSRAADDVNPPPVRPLRLLVAEDNQVNQLLAVRTIEKEGHRVDVVNNGIEAVEAVRKFPYDLVLMDVNMPEMDGLAATAKIRTMPGDKGRLPIIALTAEAMKGDRERLLAAGMNDYVSKPLDRGKLIAAINAWSPSGDVVALDTEIESELETAQEPTMIQEPECGPEAGTGQDAMPAVRGADDADPILDTQVMEDWRAFFSEAEFSELVTTQAVDARECLQDLKNAAEAGEFVEVERFAHSLKSSCGSLGMCKVAATAKAMEMACRGGRPDDAVALLPTIDEQIDEAMIVLEQHYAAYITPSRAEAS